MQCTNFINVVVKYLLYCKNYNFTNRINKINLIVLNVLKKYEINSHYMYKLFTKIKYFSALTQMLYGCYRIKNHLLNSM